MFVYEKYDYSLFEGRFKDMNRFDGFGYLALKALFLYLEELAESSDTSIEVDVIGLCCEWSVYTEEQAINDYTTNDTDSWRDNVSIVIDLDDGTYLICS